MPLVLHRFVHASQHLFTSEDTLSKSQCSSPTSINIAWKEMEAAIIASYKNNLPLKFDIEFRPFRLDPSLPCDHALDKVRSVSPHRSSIFDLPRRHRMS
jgi:hypothetical protein